VDNANSGTNVETTVEAARYARALAGNGALTLVIGEEARAICEGFSRRISRGRYRPSPDSDRLCWGGHEAATLDEG